MIQIEVKGLGTALKSIGVDLPKQTRYATMVALTRTASKVRDRQYSEMHRVFDRPTPYTLRAIRVKPATKSDLSAWVGFKKPWAATAEDDMPSQVEGGGRPLKALELFLQQRVTTMSPQGKRGAYPKGTYFVPGRGARLDAYGNMSRGQVQQILSALQAHTDRLQNETVRSRKRAKRTVRYWATQRGIWEIKGQSMLMALVAVKRKPLYSKRYPFYEISRRFVGEIWPGEFDRAFAKALATARS